MPSGGNIVINGSMVSIKGIPAFGVSAATKAALRSFARTWAVDLKGSNIRVNIIAPGTIVTLGYKSELGLSDEQIEDFKAQAAATTPLGRTGVPEEVAAAVLFLASDESSYVNGVESRANLKVQSNAILASIKRIAAIGRKWVGRSCHFLSTKVSQLSTQSDRAAPGSIRL